MTPPHDVFRIAFASVRGLTRSIAAEILARCGSEEEFFSLPASRLSSLMQHSARIFDSAYRDSLLRQAEKEYDFVLCNNIRLTYFTDPGYPARLAEADDAPLMLYTLGDADLNPPAVIGIVGKRHMTPYGRDFTSALVSGLAATLAAPPLIVSGLAFGVDVEAHRAALSAGLPTAAVLAHGLNTIYPAQHRDVAARMVRSGGMLISDYRSCDPVHKGNFLARNRIVAALCDCIVVVESAAKGGALSTAAVAARYNRDIFALPGRCSDKYSAGCNNLIARNVAQLITSPDDLAAAMRWPLRADSQTPSQPALFPELSPVEQTILDAMSRRDDITLSELTVATGLPVGRLMAVMVDLEFKRLISPVPGGLYRLVAYSS